MKISFAHRSSQKWKVRGTKPIQQDINMRRQHKHTRRRFKTWHVIVALAIFLLVLFHISGSYKLKKSIQALQSRGHPVSLEELDRSYSLPQGARNAADIYLEAFLNYKEWDKNAMRALGKVSSPARTESMDASARQLVEKFLSDNQITLSLLYQAASIEHCRYPVDFTRRDDSTTPWLDNMRKSSRLLPLDTLIQCENQDPDKAIESIRASLALARSLDGPLLTHRLTYVAVRGQTYRNIERMLNRITLTDEQLLTLAGLVTTSDMSDGFKRALVAEQCLGLQVVQAPIRDIVSQTGYGKGLFLMLIPWKMLGLCYRDALMFIELMQKSIDALELPEPEHLKAFDAVQESVGGGMQRSIIAYLIWPIFARTFNIDIRHQAHCRVTQAGIAVERYRLAEGRLPQSLDNLVPAYIKAVPADPYDGRPLKYRSLETGYVVYSIGDDSSDDGGLERGKGERGPKGKPAPWDITFIVER